MTNSLKFSLFALAVATLWCALPRDSHSRATHVCSCTECAHGAYQIGCTHTDDSAHTLAYLTPVAGSLGSSDTCTCTNCPLPSSEKAVSVIDQYSENTKKVASVAFYPFSGPAPFERCDTFEKTQNLHIPSVRQLYILKSSLLM